MSQYYLFWIVIASIIMIPVWITTYAIINIVKNMKEGLRHE